MENKKKNDELFHYGVKGQKWGVRRYQNKDGSLTPAGHKRLYKELKNVHKDYAKRLGGAVGRDDTITEAAVKVTNSNAYKKYLDAVEKSNTASLVKQQREDVKTARKNLRDGIKNKLSDSDIDLLRESYGLAKMELNDNKNKNMDVEKAFKDRGESFKSYKKEIRKTAEEYIGKYADKPIKDFSKQKITAGEELSKQIEWGIGIQQLDNPKLPANRKRLFEEYNNLAKTTGDLYNKRYDGIKLSAKEAKTLNDGLARVEELEEILDLKW